MMIDTGFLATIPAFSSLPASALEEMSAHWKRIEKEHADVIFSTGESADSIYIIEQGSVMIGIHDIHGNRLVLSHLTQGEMFGELTLFEITRRTATASASGDVVLLQMPRDSFIHFLRKYPEIAIKMLASLSRRLRDTNQMLEQQVTRNVNDAIQTKFTFADRIADRASQFIGSWTFILSFIALLIVWTTINTYAFLFRPLDPYPFILLNLILSCLAALQGPLIMMSQGRQAKKDHLAAELDYKINLKAELQIEVIMEKLDQVMDRLSEKS